MRAVTKILKSAGNPGGAPLVELLSDIIADVQALDGDLRLNPREGAQVIHQNNAQIVGFLRAAIQHSAHSRAVLDGARPAEPLDAMQTAAAKVGGGGDYVDRPALPEV